MLYIYIYIYIFIYVIYIYINTKKLLPSKHHIFSVTSLDSRIPLLEIKNVIKYIMEYNIILFISKPLCCQLTLFLLCLIA